MTGSHGQQILHRHGREIVADRRGEMFREKRNDLVLEVKTPAGDREPYRAGGHALGQGMHHVNAVGPIRRPPSFGDDMAAPPKHEALNFEPVLLDVVEESENASGGNALALRRCT